MDEYFYHFTDEKRDTYPWCANSASASRGIKHSVSRLASHLSRGTTSGFKMKTSGVEFSAPASTFGTLLFLSNHTKKISKRVCHVHCLLSSLSMHSLVSFDLDFC